MRIFDHCRVSAGYSCRADGNQSLFYGDTGQVLRNREVFLSGLSMDYRRMVCSRQVHGKAIAVIREKDIGKGALNAATSLEGFDGFVTDVPGVPLCVFTADCLSVFLYDPVRVAAGVIHAGWRSTHQGICHEAVALMGECFGSDPGSLRAALGPCMRGCCYQVGPEFFGRFTYGLTSRGERFYLDLPGVNTRQLLSSGILPENILDTGMCTSCSHDSFYSYRKEGASCGRILSVIMLR